MKSEEKGYERSKSGWGSGKRICERKMTAGG